jgi:two-component system, sensor histidine kinase and response regulator
VPALHVLVVEDNRINQTVAVRRIEKTGCTVEVAENGEVAVRRLSERHFDLVFMDCQMPIMDGYEATRQIRGRPEHARLPIVAMTAGTTEGDRQRCLDAGMSEYLCKPLQPGDLERIVNGLRHAAAAPERPADASTNSGVLDEAAIRSLFDDDVEAMLGLIGLITVDLPRYAARLATHVEQGEWNEVSRLAHTIKGAASNVSGAAVVEAAQAIEQASRRGDGDAVTAATAPLLTSVGTLVEALTAWGTRLVADRQANAA